MLKKATSERINSIFMVLAMCMAGMAVLASRGAPVAFASKTKDKNFAQTLIEGTLAKHPELAGMGIGTIPPRGHDCVDIADTDIKEIGEKCDKGELSVMHTGKSVVEKEDDAFDVTVPLHVSGQTIGILSMDFKLDQQESSLLDRASAIAKEVEAQIPSKDKLFDVTR
jgi:hypothetical protein